MIPHEVDLSGVFLPPLLPGSLLGLVATWLTVRLLNRYRLSRFFYYPPLVLVALTVIYTSLISIFVIPA
jgi:hypothetical protein